MQTLPPSLCFAMVVDVADCRDSCTSSNPNRRLSNLLCPAVVRLNGASVIGLGHQITNLRFACQPSHSIAAVRFSKRREMLCSRASLFDARASRPQRSRQSVHHALRQGAASPSLATHRRLQPTRVVATQGLRVLQGKPKQCSIGSFQCPPTPRMRCLTIRSTGPIAACC